MKRYSYVVILTALAGVTLVSLARAETDPYEGWTTKVVLHPAAAPSPALKYQLLPPLRDRHPGNAAIQYLLVPMSEYMSGRHGGRDVKLWDDICDWCEIEKTPLAKLLAEPKLREPPYAWLGGESICSSNWTVPPAANRATGRNLLTTIRSLTPSTCRRCSSAART